MQGSYTSGAKITSCRCCPGPCGLEDRYARCYINDVKWWLNSVSRRTLLGFSEALICLSYSALKMVPPRGNAPRSADYQSAALLLSYGGGKSPVKVTHPRLPGVGRARCYYANGRKDNAVRRTTASGLSPDRAGLRIRALEMLCICGAAERKWRSTRESHSGRFLGRSCFRDSVLVYAGRAP